MSDETPGRFFVEDDFEEGTDGRRTVWLVTMRCTDGGTAYFAETMEEDDAERIASALNACRNVSTDQLAAMDVAKVIAERDELLEHLQGIEKWEADLLLDNEVLGIGTLPTLVQPHYDAWIELQGKRAQLLRPAKERASG